MVLATLQFGRLAAAGGLLGLALLAMAAAPATAAEAPQIPLEPGVVVTSTNFFHGRDHDVLRTIPAMDAETVTFLLRWVESAPDAGVEPETFSVIRIVRREDLQSANRMLAYFHTEDPELFPGSTATQASAALLENLKADGEAAFILGAGSGPLGNVGARKYYRGKMMLVEPEPVDFPLLLNGVPTTLPAIHAKGTLTVGKDSGEAEFWWLDQPDNAMTLRGKFRDSSVQVIRIDTPEAAGEPEAQVAAVLASETCRAELHGLYFDTGSAALLPESSATIAELADALQDNASWRVTIEGHTDAIGSDADNLSLSQRRADAVRIALIDSSIAVDRLAAEGFGESRPVDSNDTIEGRARNRRVEIARECP